MRKIIISVICILNIHISLGQCRKSFFPLEKQPTMGTAHTLFFRTPLKNYYFHSQQQRTDSVFGHLDKYTTRMWNDTQWSYLPSIEFRGAASFGEWKGQNFLGGNFHYVNGMTPPKGKMFTLFTLKNGVWDSVPGTLIDSMSNSYPMIHGTEKHIFIVRLNSSTSKWELYNYDSATAQYKYLTTYTGAGVGARIIATKNRLYVANISSIDGKSTKYFAWIDDNLKIHTTNFTIPTISTLTFGADRLTGRAFFANMDSSNILYEFDTSIIAQRNTRTGIPFNPNMTNSMVFFVRNGELVWSIYDKNNHHHLGVLCSGETKWRIISTGASQNEPPQYFNDPMPTDHGFYVLESTSYQILKLGAGSEIKGIYYGDLDSNCTFDTSTDVRTQNALIGVWAKAGTGAYTTSDVDGSYSLIVSKGEYEFRKWKHGYSSCFDDSVIIAKDTLIHKDIPAAVPPLTDLAIYYQGGFRARWNRTAKLNFRYNNFGRFCDSAIVEINLDPRCHAKPGNGISYDSSKHRITVLLDNIYTFKNDQLSFEITHDTSQTKVDSVLCFSGSIYSLCGDADSSDNTFEFCVTLVYSLDPNRKDCEQVTIPKDEVSRLNYYIEFQNEGSDFAENIVIRDTLSTNLNMESFQITGASHTYQVKLVGRILEITFPDINLIPKSQNAEASIGYFQYSINTNSGLKNGDVITNSASIYFDLNKPVKTNTTFTKVPWPLSVNHQLKSKKLISVYPNPAGDQLYLKNSGALEKELKIFNMNGILISSFKVPGYSVNSVNISNYSNGVYLVRCTNETTQIIIAH